MGRFVLVVALALVAIVLASVIAVCWSLNQLLRVPQGYRIGRVTRNTYIRSPPGKPSDGGS